MQCGIGACNIESNSCDCAPGYTGRHCHDCAEGFELAFATFEYYSQSLGCLPLLTPCHEPCSSHRLDLCDCCPSGVFNDAGGCCPLADGALVPPIVDKDGQCCEAGYLDGCGICGGTSVGVDVTGECCPVRFLAALGFRSFPYCHELTFLSRACLIILPQ